MNFQALNSRITQLEDSLSDALRSSRSNNALVSSLEDDLRTARTTRDRYREEIERLRDENEKLKGNTETAKELQVEIMEERTRLMAENVRLQEKLERITAERAQPRRVGNLGETSTNIVKGEDAEQHRNVASSSSSPVRTIKVWNRSLCI